MSTQIMYSPDELAVFVIHEPGNMTRYIGTAFKIQNGPVGYKNHWVVSFPEFGSSTIIEEGQKVDVGYAMEKLGTRRTGYKLGKTDVSEMTKMIKMMVPNVRIHGLCTDATGHEPDEVLMSKT